MRKQGTAAFKVTKPSRVLPTPQGGKGPKSSAQAANVAKRENSKRMKEKETKADLLLCSMVLSDC